RIAAYWDGQQNLPFAPWDFAPNHDGTCGYKDADVHPVNDLLGDTNIFSNGQWPKLYVVNPRNGRWAAFDLLETGVGTGDFVSVTCIDIASQYACVPTLGVQPGDTLLAVYQDPSNHSDYAWISIKVNIGGAPLDQGSTTSFVDAEGNDVDAYHIGDQIYVKVIDRSVAGAGTLSDAVTIAGNTYNLNQIAGAQPGTFMTDAISIPCSIGDTINATYVDPSDASDTSSDSVTIVGSELRIDSFYAGPNPFTDSVSFAYKGDGMATNFSVSLYDLSGHRVWQQEKENTLSVQWDGRDSDGKQLANGGYIYVVMATDGTNTFTGKGTVFINR
ncbi:gliding motility-associated C-terminal domain-containing protein, partial [Candidatus Bipolaricaulota bacterium]|nr:gliding motility-associated C-terminal domain-containing protein [Candidatus Bipolaricaulota bacterium]